MNYENKIIDAIETIVTNAVQKANYDKTIQGIIMRCIDKETGKYLVKYQDASIEAYSNDTSQTYSNGIAVYVLIPGNDMSQIKTIIGTVDKLGDNYIEISNSIDNFQSIGNSIITNEDTFGICSYKNPDGIILYDADSGEEPLINVDTFAADLYLKKANYIILSADFKTSIDKVQRYKGDYGLAVELEFYSSNGEILEKTYLLNTNNMTGNPYEYFNNTSQKTIYEIDGENFSRIKKITFYSHDFPYEAQDKENDIFIKNIELVAATKNTDEDNSGNYLILRTSKGIYFDDNDSDESDRTVYAQIKINNKTIKDGAKELKYFWFRLNRKITSANLKYNRYGGNGWECLNNYTVIGDNIIEWDTTNYNFKTLKSDNLAKENNYKCVVVYNDEIVLSKEFSIFNYSSLYDTSIISDNGFNFYNGNGNPTLTCLIKDLDINEYDFYWSYIDSNGQFNNIAETVSNKNTLKINVSEIFNYNTYICSVYKNDILVGEAKATITNEISNEITYNIIIENGKQIFKYDEEGLSPMSKKFDNPQEIYPLSFKLYDSKGIEVDLDTLETSSYSWIVPNQNSMIEILDSEGEPSEVDTENYNDIYTGKKNLFFRIASIYDYEKTRNSIEIRVNYNNKIISATTDFIFLKEGENGSNGTDYICRIVLNNKDINSKLNYPIVYHNNASGKIELNYDRPIGEENTWFKIMLYKESERAEIFKGSSTGMSTENKPVNVRWEILKNKYSITKSDISNFSINALTGELSYQNYGESIPANIIKCTVKYNDINYIATLPITLVETNEDYKINLIENTGFRSVFYSSDGRQPKYDNSKPFTLDTLENDNNNFSYNWNSVGRIYLNEWTNVSLLTKIEENKNTVKFQPSETYDGYCVNNSIICNISNGGNQIAKIYIPIYLYLNKYGNAALNDWDGNSIQVNEDGGYILSPQIGAGYKDQNNAFTGIFMGSVAQEKEVKTGLFGYSEGVQTILLDAEKGSATFGKSGSGQIIIEPSEDKAVLRSGNYNTVFSQASGKYLGGRVYFKKIGDIYTRLKESIDYTIGSSIAGNNIYVWSGGEGLEIDLVDPHIYFGSGNFRLEKDGSVYADGYATIADLENGEYEIPSSSVENLDNFIAKTADDIEDLQNQIDGNITTWFYDYMPKPRYDYPTENANKPASDWKDDKERQNHVGDLFYDSITGYCYRYMPKEVNGTTYYVWIQLSDSDIAAALAAAEKAQDTADNKRRVFYTQPIPPYDLGDLWAQGPNGELLKCIKAKTENQTFNLSDWDLASKYTDDTAVENLKKEVISEVIVQYALSSSTSQQPSESDWSDIAPVWEDGKYMWQRTITIYADSTVENPHQDISNPTCIAGAAGQNAYTVILTNENQSIAAGVSAAIPTTISTDVIGYKGVNQVNTSVGTISNLPTGINATIKNNGKKNTSIEFTITNELTTEMGTITIPIIIDGITFNKKFSYTLSKTGVGVRAIIEYYAINNDKDNAPADNQFSVDFVAPTAQNRYLWNYEKITYTDNSVVSTSKRIIGNYSEDGEHGTSITGVVNKYQVSTSSTTAPSTWQDTPPQLTATNKYLWNYEIISYSSGSPTETTPCVIGVYGDKGDSITITSKSVSYQLSNSGTTTPTGEWKNNVPTLTQGKYLWTRTYVKYSDNTENTSYSVSYIAIDGSAGRGISSSTVTYQASNSGTETPTGDWKANPPAIAEGQYLWTKTEITYTDGQNPTTSYSVSYKGINGTSVSISSQEIKYAEGTSGTNHDNLNWQSSIPAVEDGKYLWTRTIVNYSDGNSTVSYSVSYQSEDGQDATQYYTHIMYATNSSGANISSDPAGKTYIGVKVDTNETASTTPGDYTWNKFVGDDATQYYTYIRYSQYSDGHDYVTTPTSSTKYVGLCVTTSTTPPAYNNSAWKWSKYVGDNATQYYTHVMYADDNAGTNISSNPSGKTYIGIRVDEVQAASTNPNDYTWSKFIGTDGTDGFSLWTATVAPTNNKYTKSQLTGPTDTPRIGEIIIRNNRYQYTITAVSGNNITVGSAVDLKGADGTNGTSITWKGDLSAAPANPQLLWAYYNTVDKKSYIYNGSSWDQMTTDGTNATQYYYHVVYCNNTSTGEGYSTSPSNQLYTGTYVDTTSADASSWSGLSGKNVKWNYTKGDDGVDSTNIVCGNEAQAIVCNSDGKVSVETTITIPFAGYIGSSKAACSVTYSTLPSGMSLVSNTAGTATKDGSLIFKVAKNTTLGNISNGVITLTFSCNSKNFVKTFSWSKALAGIDGTNGRSVTSITEQYYLSTSKTELIGGEWVEDYSLINWELNKYVWTRSKIIYKNSDDTTSTEYTTAQCSSEWEAVNEIQVGGRNLLLKTNQGTTNWGFNLGNKYNRPDTEVVTWLNQNALKLTTKELNETYTTSWRVICYNDKNIKNILKPKTTYVLSFDSTNKHTGFGIQDSNSANNMVKSYTHKEIERYDENGDLYYHMEFVFTTKDELTISNQYIYINSDMDYFDTPGTVVKYANIKVELGNKSTSWSAAPEDTISYIDENITYIQEQIDGAVQFWNGAETPTLNNEPAVNWTTEDEKAKHQKDIYTVIQGDQQGKSYQFDKVNNTWQWVEITDTEISAVQALAASKAKVFVVTPFPPYNVGDLWLRDEELWECITAKTFGSFSESDWQKSLKYTDDTAINNLQIGGRNLLLNTSNEEWSFNSSWSDNYKFSDYAKEYVKADDTLTLSLEAKGSVEMYFDFYYRSSSASYIQVKYFFPGFHVTTEYQKFTFTGLSGMDLTDIVILRIRQNASMHGTGAAQGDLYIKNLKLEKGNKATDWTAAPEDAIETIDVEYYLSTSKTTTSGGSWQTTAPEWVNGKYMWSRQKVIYGNGSYITRNATCIAGATGETGSGMKFFGTRNWTDAQITGTYIIGYSTTWTNSLGIEIKVGDLLLLEVTNTTYNTKFQYILETSAVAANGKPTATIVAITQDGHDGTDAKVVNISASSQIFKSTTGASGTFTPQYIYLYPNFQNVTYSKWQYSTNGTTWTDVTSDENGLTIGTYNSIPNSLRIIRTSELYTDSITSISFKCLSNDDKTYDTVSVVKIYDVTELEVGGRNYIYYGKGNNKLGFFKNFATVNTEEGYGEHTLVSQKTYRSINIKPGYIIPITDYIEGQNIRFSFDIMFTQWDFPEGASAQEWWIGQRYSSPSWKGITQFNMPRPGVTAGCELNQWYHFSATKKILSQPEDTSGGNVASIQLYNPSADVEARTTFRIKNVKLEFGNMETDWSPSVEEIQDQFNINATNLANAVLEINNDIEDLQNQIDGNITTWFYNYVPTLQNEPASLWTTDDIKNNHLGDLFYNTDTGYCYRFMVSEGTYSWSRLKDDEISEALALAQTAKDTADNKRRVFYSTPVPPYDQGDLWVQGENGDILRCQTPKASGASYSIDDWVLASKYTDDGLAQQANDKIDNLELGGRNLIPDTSNDWKEVSVNNFYGTIISSEDFFGLEVGDEYTLRFKVRTETGKILKARIQFFTDSSNRTSVYGKETVQNGEGYVTYSGTLTEAQKAYTSMQICVDSNSSPAEAKTGTTTEYYAELKLEKGNRYTDWTPAPEDLKANQQLWYTTTSTVTPPASSAIWSKTTPTSSDYYIWQKIITTYSNGVTEESDVACIYSPTVTISSIVTQYYIHNSKTVAPSNTAAGWSDEKPEWKSSYYGSRFLWIRTKYNYTGGKASEYSTPYYDPTWEAIGELEKSIQDSATLVNDSINNGTVQIHDGYIDIKNGEDQGIRFSSGGISFKINNEYTSVWDITGKFNAEKILVENLTASSILSGTLTLKAAEDDTNGVFILQNADGVEVARIDVNGLKVTAVDGSYVWLRTGEDDPTKKGLYLCDAQGNTYFQNDTTNGIVEIEKEKITEYQEYAEKVRIIPISSGSTVRGIGFIGV